MEGSLFLRIILLYVSPFDLPRHTSLPGLIKCANSTAPKTFHHRLSDYLPVALLHCSPMYSRTILHFDSPSAEAYIPHVPPEICCLPFARTQDQHICGYPNPSPPSPVGSGLTSRYFPPATAVTSRDNSFPSSLPHTDIPIPLFPALDNHSPLVTWEKSRYISSVRCHSS